MSTGYLLIILLVLTFTAYYAGSRRALSFGKLAHSRPGYHGSLTAIAAVVPALIFVFFWQLLWPLWSWSAVAVELPPDVRGLDSSRFSLIRGTIEGLAGYISNFPADVIAILKQGEADALAKFADQGIALASPPEPYALKAAFALLDYAAYGAWISTIISLILVASGFALAYSRIKPEARARNMVERMMRIGLAAASAVAILTTIGIVSSVVVESAHFFQKVSFSNFFLGTVWDPRFSAAGGGSGGGEGQFGIIPLLWGTLFISFIAMLVAVPVGLFSAIYMSEYASSAMRGFSKPVLEVLAGIPTIVYGFFALTTFGPFLRDMGGLAGFEITANSAMSAGIVMGIMIIPFVSSLSDDIISSVPNSLREGSYALGATQSETIRKVVLPAALPGVVGAILLAVSRAVGETMIVVLAAGIAANITLNPFEPVTTITVKIVSQLTGDLEFTSPQTLVAYALGLTLFVVTLGLNIFALYIVRRYREQYE